MNALIHREFCAPVVVTVTSPEVEKISLKNGLLFHDLLRYLVHSYYDFPPGSYIFFSSAFGHIDSISTTVRVSGNNIPVREGHIRFESVSELFPKSSANIEEVDLYPLLNISINSIF
jgi:hypothetical protein